MLGRDIVPTARIKGALHVPIAVAVRLIGRNPCAAVVVLAIADLCGHRAHRGIDVQAIRARRDPRNSGTVVSIPIKILVSHARGGGVPRRSAGVGIQVIVVTVVPGHGAVPAGDGPVPTLEVEGALHVSIRIVVDLVVWNGEVAVVVQSVADLRGCRKDGGIRVHAVVALLAGAGIPAA